MRILVLAIALLLIPACSSRRAELDDGASVVHGGDSADYDEVATDARYYYLRGQLALASDDMPGAEHYLVKAAELEHAAAPSLRNSLAFMYVRTGKFDAALAAVNEGLKDDPANPDLLQTKAAVYAASKKYDEAIASLLLIKNPPADRVEEYYNFLSTLYIQKGDINGAQASLAELVSKRPDSFIAHYQLGRIYEASGNPGRAELEYSKAMEISSDQRGILVDLSRTLTSQKKYKEAETLLSRGLAKDPTDVALYNAKVQLFLVQQRSEAAMQELQKLAKIETDSTQTRTRIAIILIDQKKYKEAIVMLRELMAEKPEQLGLNYYLASALASSGKNDEAKEVLKKIEPGAQLFVESRLMAATIAQQQKDTNAALGYVEEALRARPDNVQLLSFKGQLKRELGHRDEALAIQLQLIKLEPNEEKHKFLYAVYLDELGRSAESIVALRAIVQKSPSNASALNYLGYKLVETEGSDLQEAEQYIKRAIALEPTNGYYLDSLGWLYYKQKRFPEADTQMALAVKYVPDDAVILEHYVHTLIEVGNKAEAKRILARAKKNAPQSDDKQVGERLQALSQSLAAK